MAGDDAAANEASVGDRFPALKQLEEEAERAKLVQAIAEARTKATTAALPSTDVELTRDTVTAAEKTTGVIRVLVQMCSSVLADDIADLVLDELSQWVEAGEVTPKFRIRVFDDPDLIRGVDVARVLRGQIRYLRDRIDEYTAGVDADVVPEALLAAGPLVGLGLQALGLVSKLSARDYQVSGAEAAVDDLGFDLLLARRLLDKRAADEELEVAADRIMPTPEPQILTDLWTLALDAQLRLARAVAAAAGARAAAQATLDTDEAEITALDAQILKLIERIPDDGAAEETSALAAMLERLRQDRAGLAAGLPGLRDTLATTRERHERGADLAQDVDELLTSALTPAAEGIRPPAIQAARVEGLVDQSEPATHFLFARLVAGGVDHTIEGKIGKDRWFSLAGCTAEFALLASDGRLLTSGVRPALQASQAELGNLRSFRQERPGYVAVERRTRETGAR